ncbi:hypothetical protein HYALB_00003882 [Hymenoscyphus albidus]|uniref:Uncharacterized protein n=1 Tax=Hymenoscyphus albidus TaxID=595503 RepID=A0A9N9QAP1_9HELO|nr:hypothetical protein HYALB_00003882 [Hymenoscyphus albidus]
MKELGGSGRGRGSGSGPGATLVQFGSTGTGSLVPRYCTVLYCAVMKRCDDAMQVGPDDLLQLERLREFAVKMNNLALHLRHRPGNIWSRSQRRLYDGPVQLSDRGSPIIHVNIHCTAHLPASGTGAAFGRPASLRLQCGRGYDYKYGTTTQASGINGLYQWYRWHQWCVGAFDCPSMPGDAPWPARQHFRVELQGEAAVCSEGLPVSKPGSQAPRPQPGIAPPFPFSVSAEKGGYGCIASRLGHHSKNIKLHSACYLLYTNLGDTATLQNR